ncbi:MAG: methyltransferase domain-containing protein [Bacteroidales bacterium]|jgi:hypothetical protein|nr:methyltransferase domain-containing protein [Bacteroidales bacterium]
MDPYGKACVDYLNGKRNIFIKFSSEIAELSDLPVEYLFRTYDEMPAIEQKALEMAKGNILDAGAGAGSHCLELQSQGKQVTALEISPLLCQVMKDRGLESVVNADIYGYRKSGYDTILFLMNGIGICETMDGFKKLLIHLKTCLAPKGQIILDSSDLIYMFLQEDGSIQLPLTENYYGEMPFKISYKSQFLNGKWLYIDPDNLDAVATSLGYSCEIIMKGTHYDYLARLSMV